MLSGGFSGLSITHSDIGGYTTFAGVIPGITLKVNMIDIWRLGFCLNKLHTHQSLGH